MTQLMYLNKVDEYNDINLLINCPLSGVEPGGAEAVLNLYQCMKMIAPRIRTFALGACYDWSALILAAGEKGQRFAMQHTSIEIRNSTFIQPEVCHQKWIHNSNLFIIVWPKKNKLNSSSGIAMVWYPIHDGYLLIRCQVIATNISIGVSSTMDLFAMFWSGDWLNDNSVRTSGISNSC